LFEVDDGSMKAGGIGAVVMAAPPPQRSLCWPPLSAIGVSGALGSINVTVSSAVTERTVGGAICAGTYTAPVPIGWFHIDVLVNG